MKVSLPQFSDVSVLVVGDAMLDRYWQGDTSRISPEAPVPVVKVNHIEERLGGAANVGLNLAVWGVNAQLIALTGDDPVADVLAEKLHAAHVDAHLVRLGGIDTTTKLRVISRHQQLIRMDFEESEFDVPTDELLKLSEQQLLSAQSKKNPTEVSNKELSAKNQQALSQDNNKSLNQQAAKNQVLLLSDYGKGVLKESAKFIKLAASLNVPVIVDPKQTNYEAYRGATMITPNMNEFESVVGKCRCEADIVSKGRVLMRQFDIKALLITRGGDGMTLLEGDRPPVHVPVHEREVFDVTGAGDTVIAMMAASIGAGKSMEDAMHLANLAASISVSKLGVATVSIPELENALDSDDLSGCVNEDQLLTLVAEAKKRGEKIVMTNGCFDILHVGHVSYMQKARALGDRLIVAVNTDASVKRLKGEERPINNTEQRMQVLASLGAVDWVVPFGEDTPARLIEKIMPDVLTKGGDYKVEEIAGGEAVIGNGGEVIILPFVDDVSTTATINKLKNL